jgi:hypothetical protein
MNAGYYIKRDKTLSMSESSFLSALSYIHSYGTGARIAVVNPPEYTSPLLVHSFVAHLPADCVVISGNDSKIMQDGLCCLVIFSSLVAEPSDNSYNTIQLALAEGIPIFIC